MDPPLGILSIRFGRFGPRANRIPARLSRVTAGLYQPGGRHGDRCSWRNLAGLDAGPSTATWLGDDRTRRVRRGGGFSVDLAGVDGHLRRHRVDPDLAGIGETTASWSLVLLGSRSYLRSVRGDLGRCRGCGYCAQVDSLRHGDVHMVSANDAQHTVLLQCPRCGWLYAGPAARPELAEPISESKARELFPSTW